MSKNIQNPQQSPDFTWENDHELRRLDKMAELLDNQFRIPGTNIRFGLDSLIGLVPYIGDMSGLAISGYLFSVMYRKGASVFIMLRLLGNLVIDALFGILPGFGDLFDLGFKANRRNVDMLKRYYSDGKPKPNAKVSVFILGFLGLILFICLMVGIWYVAAWIFGLLSAAIM